MVYKTAGWVYGPKIKGAVVCTRPTLYFNCGLLKREWITNILTCLSWPSFFPDVITVLPAVTVKSTGSKMKVVFRFKSIKQWADVKTHESVIKDPTHLGMDDFWRDTTNGNSLIFTGVPPFKLTSNNSSGIRCTLFSGYKNCIINFCSLTRFLSPTSVEFWEIRSKDCSSSEVFVSPKFSLIVVITTVLKNIFIFNRVVKILTLLFTYRMYWLLKFNIYLNQW